MWVDEYAEAAEPTDAAGNVESPKTFTWTFDTTPPADPVLGTVTRTDSSFTLNWSAAAGADGYYVNYAAGTTPPALVLVLALALAVACAPTASAMRLRRATSTVSVTAGRRRLPPARVRRAKNKKER